MDNQEIINELLRMKKQYTGAQGCSVTHEKQNAYKASCLSAAIIAVNKQIPKEPIEGAYMDEYEDYFDSGKTFRCTECDRDIGSYSEEMQEWIWRFPYCPDCGQKIKWGE